MHVRRSLGLIAAALLAAPPALAQTRGYGIPAGAPLPYEIQAGAGTSYQIGCRFRAVRVTGAFEMDRGLVNHLDLSGRGPETGVLPTDNGRCTVKLLRGKGPVTLILRKNGKAHSAVSRRVGETARVLVY